MAKGFSVQCNIWYSVLGVWAPAAGLPCTVAALGRLLSGVNFLVFDKTVVLVAFVGLLAGVDALIHYEG